MQGLARLDEGHASEEDSQLWRQAGGRAAGPGMQHSWGGAGPTPCYPASTLWGTRPLDPVYGPGQQRRASTGQHQVLSHQHVAEDTCMPLLCKAGRKLQCIKQQNVL